MLSVSSKKKRKCEVKIREIAEKTRKNQEHLIIFILIEKYHVYENEIYCL